MRFGTKSFLAVFDTFTSITMVTWPKHFNDPIPTKKDSILESIEGGLAIKDKGRWIAILDGPLLDSISDYSKCNILF
jgi:hypothetical protein